MQLPPTTLSSSSSSSSSLSLSLALALSSSRPHKSFPSHALKLIRSDQHPLTPHPAPPPTDPLPSTLQNLSKASSPNQFLFPSPRNMTLSTRITVADGNLQVHGKTLLSSVPSNVSLTCAQSMGLLQGAFLGVSSSSGSKHHHLVFPLGILEGLRFVCCFRFKLWWMTQRMGTCGRDVPLETQFLLVEGRDGSPMSGEMDVGSGEETVYTVFLPLLEGAFRASLQGNEKNELQLCLESGDTATGTSQGVYSVFVNAGTNPFQVISDSVRTVEKHLQTFRHREEKKMPSLLDWLGWCTWDAFYRDVTPQGIKEGLESLIAGGTPPRFVIIDDGWQSVASDEQPATDTVSTGSIFETRLTNIKENHKFQKDGKDGQSQEDPALGLKHMVDEAKKRHNVKYIYVWHAITGYWGGVKPGVAGMEHYESALKYPVHSPGIVGNQAPEKNDALDFMAAHGLGLVHPKKVFHFYDELHSYLAAAGIDGVKVDVQNILETLGADYGGRVSLTRQYLQALEASIARNFPDNGCIACMCHNTDGLYSSKQTAIVRASDDFFPHDPASHTIHIASVAYNSLFLGEFMQPDWDMFHSLHPAAEYHAAARAVGGSAIYVSDKPGNHNFDVLKKVALPDGSVLRARLPGRPSRDCLFSDPVRDGKSLLKIWNMNKHTGVIGVFNCQGAGWCSVEKKNIIHDGEPKTITGSVHARDVEFLQSLAGDDWCGDCVMYSHRGGELVRLPKSSALPVTLKVLEYEVFTVTPVKEIGSLGISFAPVGLISMFNAGGAVDSLEYDIREGGGRSNNVIDDMPSRDGDGDPIYVVNTTIPSSPSSSLGRALVVKMKIKGCGEMGVYSSMPPKRFLVEQSPSLDFTYHAKTGLAILLLPTPPQEGHLWDVQVEI